MKKRSLMMIFGCVLGLALSACSSEPQAQTPEEPAEQEIEAQEQGVTEALRFDYAQEIAAYQAKEEGFTVPQAAQLPFTLTDSLGATGVVMVADFVDAESGNLYLNALVNGNALHFTGDIASLRSSRGSEVTQEEDGFSVVPQPLSVFQMEDEVLEVTMNDGTVYALHTVHQLMVGFEASATGQAESGVYTFSADKFLLRVATDGTLLYYRCMSSAGELMVENFKAQDTADGRYYSYFCELKPEYRNGMGGFSSGMYVVMDENYQEINYVTLNANEDKQHGEGYLDQHEFLMLAENHWISLSYTPLLVDNLPSGGIDGGNTAYVWAGIIQEVKDGAVLHEYDTTEYDWLYASAQEGNDYPNSSAEGTADDWMDYVHVNSVSIDPKDDNLIVSMRNQYAVYKFSRQTGEILWTLGGTENDFTGLDAFLDENGYLFVGQHYAMYVDSAVAGNDSSVTVFDNHTSFAQNLTRTFEFVLDEEAKTASASVINGSDLDAINGKLHWATHCGSVERQSQQSVLIGWGLHAIFDNDIEMITQHPVFTDYNPSTETIEFELSLIRNEIFADMTHEACFSYRTYKTAD